MKYRDKIYGSYVSSGQARISSETAKMTIRANSPYIKNIIDRFVSKNKDIVIYDLGCGYGKFLYEFKNKGYYKIKGVDLSHEQVNIAHQLGMSEIECDDISSFLIKQIDSPDLILMMDILEHFTKDEIFEILDLVFRKLNNGSKLIVHVPNGEGIFGNRIIYGDLSHEIGFTPSSITQALNILGFKKVMVYEDKPIIHSIFSFFRRIIWEIGTLPFRILFMAETGRSKICLSQNMTIVAEK